VQSWENWKFYIKLRVNKNFQKVIVILNVVMAMTERAIKSPLQEHLWA
jgi:hypothetical protein